MKTIQITSFAFAQSLCILHISRFPQSSSIFRHFPPNFSHITKYRTKITLKIIRTWTKYTQLFVWYLYYIWYVVYAYAQIRWNKLPSCDTFFCWKKTSKSLKIPHIDPHSQSYYCLVYSYMVWVANAPRKQAICNRYLQINSIHVLIECKRNLRNNFLSKKLEKGNHITSKSSKCCYDDATSSWIYL